MVDAMVQLSFAVQGILTRVATEADLSMTQLRLLGVLRDREPGMLQLADLLGLDKSSVTGLIDRAERRGLVRRAASPDDGRAVRVVITPHGRAVAARGAEQVERELTRLVAPLSADERKALTTTVKKLLAQPSEG